jgi:hypothetical protein
MVFFTDTAGPCPATLSTQYPPLQQLALDLQNDKVANYNWTTDYKRGRESPKKVQLRFYFKKATPRE